METIQKHCINSFMEDGRLVMKEDIYFSQHVHGFIVDNLIKKPKLI